MSTECRVGALGVERRECERPRSGRSDVPLLPLAIVLALVLVGGIVLLNLPLAGTMSAGVGTTVGEEATGLTAERGASFDFVDHELAHAGGYVLRPVEAREFALGNASDPVQATLMEAREVGERALGASPLAGPEYLVSRSRARMPEEAEIARLRGLSGPGAASRARSDELVHLRGLMEAAVSSDAVGAAREAEIARLSGLSGPGAASRARSDELVHLRGLMEAALSSDALDGETCSAWSETMARFHAAKRVDDPANGASSNGEAAFYVARFGSGDVGLLARAGSLRESVCRG